MALSINEEGEEFIEDVLEKATVNPNKCILTHQQSSRPYRLRRQVKYYHFSVFE